MQPTTKGRNAWFSCSQTKVPGIDASIGLYAERTHALAHLAPVSWTGAGQSTSGGGKQTVVEHFSLLREIPKSFDATPAILKEAILTPAFVQDFRIFDTNPIDALFWDHVKANRACHPFFKFMRHLMYRRHGLRKLECVTINLVYPKLSKSSDKKAIMLSQQCGFRLMASYARSVVACNPTKTKVAKVELRDRYLKKIAHIDSTSIYNNLDWLWAMKGFI